MPRTRRPATVMAPIFALLILCPMRRKNLAGLVVGQHLVFDGQDHRVKLTTARPQMGRPYVAAALHELTTYMDRWLQVHRPAAQLIAQAGAKAAA
jgi:hypothetical protein